MRSRDRFRFGISIAAIFAGLWSLVGLLVPMPWGAVDVGQAVAAGMLYIGLGIVGLVLSVLLLRRWRSKSHEGE